MKKTLFYLAIVFTTVNVTIAQSTASYYRQFFFNPYVFNPAFVGVNRQVELNLIYRQQWVGFKDAPTATGLNFQYPTHGRVALGFSVNADKQVLLRNTTFLSTFGYEIPLSTKQYLRFGLSGGVGLNTPDLTLDELNSTDPVIRNSGNNYYPLANFGLLYTYSNLQIGIAFNDVFKSGAFQSQSFTGFSLSDITSQIYSVRYKFNVGLTENIAIEPYLLYRQRSDKAQNAWQAASLIYFKDHIWTGASYDQASGLAFFFGVNIKEKLAASYSYELPSSVATTNSHEVQLKFKIKNKEKKSVSKSKLTAAATKPNTEAVAKDKVDENKTNATPPQKNVIAKVQPKEPASTQPKANKVTGNEQQQRKVTPSTPKSDPSAAGKPTKAATFTKGHYVVVNAFKNLEYSKKYAKEMVAKGYRVTISYYPPRAIYYAYIYASFNVDDAKEVCQEWRENVFKQAWVLSVE